MNWGDSILAGYSFLVGERNGWAVIRLMRKENPGGFSLQERLRASVQVFVKGLEGGSGSMLHEYCQGFRGIRYDFGFFDPWGSAE